MNKLKDKAVSLEYLKYELNGNILHCPILIDEALGAEARDVILFHSQIANLPILMLTEQRLKFS